MSMMQMLLAGGSSAFQTILITSKSGVPNSVYAAPGAQTYTAENPYPAFSEIEGFAGWGSAHSYFRCTYAEAVAAGMLTNNSYSLQLYQQSGLYAQVSLGGGAVFCSATSGGSTTLPAVTNRSTVLIPDPCDAVYNWCMVRFY